MYMYLKKIIFWISLLFLFSSLVFANDGDCTSTNLLQEDWLIFTQDDVKIARSHLLYYCCNEGKGGINPDDCSTAEPWPESPYWFDHLIDIGIRKLSGREDQLYPGMILDTKAKEWYEFLSDPKKAKNPTAISEEYKKNWKANPAPTIDTLENSFKDFKEMSEPSLRDKYTNLCMVAVYMVKNVTSSNKIDIVKDWYYSRCVSLMSKKIDEESLFTVAISQNSAATMLSDSWTSYTNHFLQDRLMKLRDKMIAISSYFNILLKKAPLSKNCQK